MNAEKTKKITTIGMLCALAFIAVAVCRIPIIPILKYEPKDVIIVIGGFIFGPSASLIISLVSSFVEMFTISDSGFIGLVMNVLSTCAFACTASYIYKRIHTLKGAVLGLVSGGLLMTVVMLLWNYLLTPIYYGYPRAVVVGMMPMLLFFNLVKSGLNLAITLLLYKPLVTSLRKAGLIPASALKSGHSAPVFTFHWGMSVICFVILATGILFVLASNGII